LLSISFIRGTTEILGAIRSLCAHLGVVKKTRKLLVLDKTEAPTAALPKATWTQTIDVVARTLNATLVEAVILLKSVPAANALFIVLSSVNVRIGLKDTRRHAYP
jgi:hypothetical protein